MAEIACYLVLLMGLRSHKACNQGNKYMLMCRTILCINICNLFLEFVQTNTTKISNSECHLNDFLNKITMEKMTMNKIMMNKEHKIHHNTSASNCNNIILFVMLDKNQFVGIFWQQCR